MLLFDSKGLVRGKGRDIVVTKSVKTEIIVKSKFCHE